jgi:hypothetical protein
MITNPHIAPPSSLYFNYHHHYYHHHRHHHHQHCHNHHLLLPLNFISFSLFSVGKAIHADAIPEPSIEEVDNLHKLYLEGLKDIFETYKTKFGIAEDQHLEFI